jgi:acetyl esterase/lipase
VRSVGVSWLLVSFAVHTAAAGRLTQAQLEKLHAQRVQWMKQRASLPALGVYEDFRAVLTHAAAPRADLLKAAQEARARIVFASGEDDPAGGILLLPLPSDGSAGIAVSGESAARRNRSREYPAEAMGAQMLLDPERIANWDRVLSTMAASAVAFSDPGGANPKWNALADAFRTTSVHILAHEFSAAQVEASLAAGRSYVANDWLCDPTGFAFFAANNLGVFDIGDTVPTGLAGPTQIEALLPTAAKIKLIRNGAVAAQAEDAKFSYTAREEGAYRLEAWLSAGGRDWLWIVSNPIYVGGTPDLQIPSAAVPPEVELRAGIDYVDGAEADADKHRLDLYLPKGKTNFPILFFVHGGSWRTGDRSLYRALGNRYARAGIAVAIPSYRLMPANPHPAQIEDIAAAFAWVHKHAAGFGGDTRRIYLSGHSAGGHLVSLLATDPRYLEKYDLASDAIRGVISISGVYDVRDTPAFVYDGDRSAASPLDLIHSCLTRTTHSLCASPEPPFLIAYCQWDYLSLPKQARDFDAALKKAFIPVQLIYIPQESHISEIISAAAGDSQLERAILSFVQ